LRFALSVDPTNEALVQKMAWANARRAAGEPTVPSTLGQERATNPFMRVTEPALQAATRETDPTAVTRALRTMKDGFR
jgi:hydroxyacylglutathione hydrolase